MIRVQKIYRGKAGGKYIYLSWSALLNTKALRPTLEVGQKYLVLLRPNETSMKAILAGAYVPAWDALDDEEILAIVKLE